MKETIKITYEWLGYFGRLLQNMGDELELFFRSKRHGPLKHLSACFITDSLKKPVKIKNIGVQMADEKITTTESPSGGFTVKYESNDEGLPNSKILLKMNL